MYSQKWNRMKSFYIFSIYKQRAKVATVNQTDAVCCECVECKRSDYVSLFLELIVHITNIAKKNFIHTAAKWFSVKNEMGDGLY